MIPEELRKRTMMKLADRDAAFVRYLTFDVAASPAIPEQDKYAPFLVDCIFYRDSHLYCVTRIQFTSDKK